jgi:hypothetical protein
MVASLLCVVIAALENRMRVDGSYTTLPEFLCEKGKEICVPVGLGQGNYNV